MVRYDYLNLLPLINNFDVVTQGQYCPKLIYTAICLSYNLDIRGAEAQLQAIMNSCDTLLSIGEYDRNHLHR